MIELNQINKAFEELDAVHDVSISVKKGSIYGLIGSNGAGKTTLLKILAGIYKQDKGDAIIMGQPVYENSEVKERVFFIPDTPVFIAQYTIDQMADFYEKIYPHWNEKRYLDLQAVFNIDRNKKIHKLSKGMQRQVAFWLAFSTMPDILLLDEPMDGLDPIIRKKVKSLLIEEVAVREMTVLISSHNLNEIEDLCDHIGILHKGELVIEKELDELKSDIHKVQFAFKEGIPTQMLEDFTILHEERRGSIILWIVRGKKVEVSERIAKYNPVIYDLLPLTLEEIFIYELGDVGYAIKNILD